MTLSDRERLPRHAPGDFSPGRLRQRLKCQLAQGDAADETFERYLRAQQTLQCGLLASHQAIVEQLLWAMVAHDETLYQHSVGVASTAGALGAAVGMSATELHCLRRAALLHDVGKLRIPPRLLGKSGPLDPSEVRLLRRHPLFSCAILGRFGFPRSTLLAICHHHERYDGSGYPHGLGGELIPLAARVLSVADAYCAMREHRPYHVVRSLAQACDELWTGRGRQFDPAVVETFLSQADGRA